MRNEQKVSLCAGYIVEKFDNELILYSEARTAAVYLNDTAHTIFLLCKEGMNVGQIIDYLEEAYPDQKEQIRGDVVNALETLVSNDIIVLEDD